MLILTRRVGETLMIGDDVTPLVDDDAGAHAVDLAATVDGEQRVAIVSRLFAVNIRDSRLSSTDRPHHGSFPDGGGVSRRSGRSKNNECGAESELNEAVKHGGQIVSVGARSAVSRL